MTEFIRDPVCGMPVRSGTEFETVHEGHPYGFCSAYCRDAFREDPSRFLPLPQAAERTGPRPPTQVAYLTMEVGFDPRVPTYSGGLGILAGDTLKSFADLEMPVVGVSLLHREGYFRQKLDPDGNQSEHPVTWNPGDYVRPLPTRVQVQLEGRNVVVGAWLHEIVGITGHRLPLILLDTDIWENAPEDRNLSHKLYGGDPYYRLAQEMVLGVGGLRMIRALGGRPVSRYHMNEGHSALLAIELLREGMSPDLDFRSVRDRCIFTTHTPVAAGHDRFEWNLVRRVLGDPIPIEAFQMLGGREHLNMTLLALNLSDFVNGVAKKHSIVSQEMFPGYPIHSITNGVHSRTWTSRPFAELYDRHVPGWRNDPFSLRHAISIRDEDLWAAHEKAKMELVAEVNMKTRAGLSTSALTLGFARRATQYKRADLLLTDTARLLEVARTAGPIQILFAGNAHPADGPGKELIRRIVRFGKEQSGALRVVYLENYGMEWAGLLTSGVDLWLNTPLPPLEASGTSGMKAAHNGVPSFSVLDGWWLEGCVEGVTGWSIGASSQGPDRNAQDAADLYEKLEKVIAPLFYKDRAGWIAVMRQAIAMNASYFNSHRMVQQYVNMAYS